MSGIDFSKIRVSPIMDSLVIDKITDEVYFSEKYADYISNSRLKLINPDQGGSPEQYFEGFSEIYSDALIQGSAVHELVLQPEYFELVETINRPTGKPGFISDIVYKKTVLPTDEELIAAAKDVDYYGGNLNTIQMKELKAKVLPYCEQRMNYEARYTGDKELIFLGEAMREKVKVCVSNLLGNADIYSLLHPTGLLTNPISENEQAILVDLAVDIEGHEPIVLKLKAKLDNFTIDKENNKLIINDIKTHGRKIGEFGDAVNNWRYMREMAVYATLLNLVAQKFYGMDKTDIEANFLVVSTIPPYYTKVHRLRREDFLIGVEEFQRLLKMVAYYTCYGI
jgi:hypothetical protein